MLPKSLLVLIVLGVVLIGFTHGAAVANKKKLDAEAASVKSKEKAAPVKAVPEVKSESAPAKPLKAQSAAVASFPVNANEVAADALLIPVIPSTVTGGVKDDSAFGIASGGAQGSVSHANLGLAGAGTTQGIAGGFVSPVGGAAGGTGSGLAQIGIHTRPLTAFIGVSSSGGGGLQNIPNSGPLGFVLSTQDTEESAGPGDLPDLPSPPELPHLPDLPGVPHPSRPVPASVAAAIDANTETEANPGLFALFRPITQALSSTQPSAPTGLFSLFRPISIPSFIANSPILSSVDLTPELPEAPEEDGILYSLIKPLTPSAIGSNVLAFFKPLTQFAGQADGSITFTGGITFNGFELPWNKPLFPEPPTTCPGEAEACIASCARAGKTGGIITKESCCTCSCPVPENPPGELCCTGNNDRCNKFCTQNKYYQYASGTCSKDRTCECACKVSEPCFGEVPYPFYAEALMEKRRRKFSEDHSASSSLS